MKLYYAPGACSLAGHIALHEAGLSFEHEKVDLKTGQTAGGEEFRSINPKGYVPALKLDSGELLTENVAILDWIAAQGPQLCPAGQLGRSRMIEALAYISSEVHKSFGPYFRGGSDDDKASAAKAIRKRLDYLAERIEGDYLFGPTISAADCYLFVMLTWANRMNIEVPGVLSDLRERMLERPAVRKAMEHEGLLQNTN
jgi:glutathione S-transferase